MKILFVVNIDYYFCMHWLDRANAMKNDGYDVHVLTKITSEENLRVMEGYGLIVHDLKMDRVSVNAFREVMTLFRMGWHILKIKPDLVNLITIKPAVYGGLILKVLRKKAITALAGLGFLKTLNGKEKGLTGLVKFLLRMSLSKYVVLENDSDRDFIRELKPQVDAITINGAGIDVDKFPYKKCPNGEKVKVLFASRLLWSKGLGKLVEACDRLNKNNFQIELHVAGLKNEGVKGEIPDSKIKQWSDRGSMVWHGHIEDMPNLISKVDIVCLPTTYGEGVPRILIEAASCGRPIVATDVPGCNDIVRHGLTGLLYDPLNEDGLYQCLGEIVRSRALFDVFGEKARRHVESKFSNEIIIGEWSNLYHSLQSSKVAVDEVTPTPWRA